MRKHAYLTITEEEWKELDSIITTAGFRTRTEYFTAAAFAAIYGESSEKWFWNIRNLVSTKRRDEKTFFGFLDEFAVPVLAMRGRKTAFRTLAEDLQQKMFEKCKAVPSKEEIYRLIQVYELIRKVELENYRAKVHAELYQEAKNAS